MHVLLDHFIRLIIHLHERRDTYRNDIEFLLILTILPLKLLFGIDGIAVIDPFDARSIVDHDVRDGLVDNALSGVGVPHLV